MPALEYDPQLCVDCQTIDGLTRCTYLDLDLPTARAERDKILAGVTSVTEVLQAIQTDESAGTMCSQCGEVISPDFVSCPGCGARLFESCPNCSATVDTSWTHCPYCSSVLACPAGEGAAAGELATGEAA